MNDRNQRPLQSVPPRPEGTPRPVQEPVNPGKSEANLFALDGDGFKVHLRIAEGTDKDALNALMVRIGSALAWMKSQGYQPDPFAGRSLGNGSGGGQAPAAASASSDAPRCPDCGGVVYDDRGNRPTPKSPHFKCKDKAGCGAIGWLKDDGSIDWKKARSRGGQSGQRY